MQCILPSTLKSNQLTRSFKEKKESFDQEFIELARSVYMYNDKRAEIKRQINLITNSDIRLADPGEFTKRAFLNNRIDLTKAEAVADVINSRTEASFRGGRNQRDGLL